MRDAIAQKYGISGRTIDEWTRRARNEGDLTRRPGSGVERSVYTDDFVKLLEELALTWEYHFSYAAIAERLKEETGQGSVGTVWEIMRAEKWQRITQVCRPTLTEDQRRARHEFAKLWWELNWHDPKVLIVHVDEKQFYAYRIGKVLYVPPGLEPPIQHVASKTQIPHVRTCAARLGTYFTDAQVMFIAAVGAPIPGFDGAVGIWPVGEHETVKNNSKYFSKGDKRFKSVNMTREIFINMLKTLIVPAVLKKAPK